MILNLDKSIWIYANHSKNAEIIHILEEQKISMYQDSSGFYSSVNSDTSESDINMNNYYRSIIFIWLNVYFIFYIRSHGRDSLYGFL